MPIPRPQRIQPILKTLKRHTLDRLPVMMGLLCAIVSTSVLSFFMVHFVIEHSFIRSSENVGLLTILYVASIGLEIVMLASVYMMYRSHRATLQDKDALSKNERDFRRLADNLPAYIARFDPNLRFVYVNVAYIKAVPKPVGDLLGRSVEDFVGIDPHYEKWVQVLKAARQTHEVQHIEIEYLTPYQLWLDIQVVPELGPSGSLDSLLLIAFNVTEQRRTEYIYRTILDNFPNGAISLIDHTLRITFQKGRGPEESGYDNAQFVGKRIDEITPPENMALVESNTRAALNGEHRYFEAMFFNDWYGQWVVPVMDDQGQVVSALAFTQNITQRKQAEQQRLEISLEREKRRLLDEFLRDVSHDLRTPLTTVVGSSYVLVELISRIDPDQPITPTLCKKLSERAAAIRSNTVRLNTLIDSMLEMLRLDQLPEYQFAPTDLTRLIADVISEIEPKASTKGIELAFTPPENLPPLLLDEMEFARVIQNLVGNAIRYTLTGGRVAVSIALQPQTVVIAVADTGIGIAEADLPHIFDRFYRADKVRNAASGGSGLGLAIVQKIVKAHGGEIEVESVEGVGSTFRIVLPLQPVQ